MQLIKGKACAHRSNKDNNNIPTPYSVTVQIIEKLGSIIFGNILEPCCGKNFAIAQVLYHYLRDSNKIFLQEKKIIKNPLFEYKIQDFLKMEVSNNPAELIEWIITNPPFDLWDKFILKSRQIARVGFILIGKLQFLTGIDRYNKKLYYPGEYNLKTVYNFTRQCDWRVPLRLDGTYPAGMSHYSVYYFKNGHEGKSEIDFIDNHKYIKK